MPHSGYILLLDPIAESSAVGGSHHSMLASETISTPTTPLPQGVFTIVVRPAILTCSLGEKPPPPQRSKIDGRVVATRKKDVKNKAKLNAEVANGAQERFGDERVSPPNFGP